MLLIRLFFICLSLAIASTSHAADAYTVIYVYDGDTVKLRPVQNHHARDDFKLRLTDIDAPEHDQDFGLDARLALIKLCQGDAIRVTATLVGTDQYKRALGRLQCNQVDVSLYLVANGWAWHSAKFSHDINLANAASKAKMLKLGLWANDQPIPPWTWRHTHAQ